MKKLAAILTGFFCMAANTTAFPGGFAKVPAGLVADNVGMWGLFGILQNINALEGNNLVPIVLGTQTASTISSGQFVTNVLDISGSPASAVTLTTPTYTQIASSLPSTLATDGTTNFYQQWMNDGTGQTVTISAGAGVTITGNNTVSNNMVREFFVNINIQNSTVTMVNKGTYVL